MVARGAGKNEAIVAENSLRSGRKKMARKFPLSSLIIYYYYY